LDKTTAKFMQGHDYVRAFKRNIDNYVLLYDDFTDSNIATRFIKTIPSTWVHLHDFPSQGFQTLDAAIEWGSTCYTTWTIRSQYIDPPVEEACNALATGTNQTHPTKQKSVESKTETKEWVHNALEDVMRGFVTSNSLKKRARGDMEKEDEDEDEPNNTSRKTRASKRDRNINVVNTEEEEDFLEDYNGRYETCPQMVCSVTPEQQGKSEYKIKCSFCRIIGRLNKNGKMLPKSQWIPGDPLRFNSHILSKCAFKINHPLYQETLKWCGWCLTFDHNYGGCTQRPKEEEQIAPGTMYLNPERAAHLKKP
jgi:hypothetical protein